MGGFDVSLFWLEFEGASQSWLLDRADLEWGLSCVWVCIVDSSFVSTVMSFIDILLVSFTDVDMTSLVLFADMALLVLVSLSVALADMTLVVPLVNVVLSVVLVDVALLVLLIGVA